MPSQYYVSTDVLDEQLAALNAQEQSLQQQLAAIPAQRQVILDLRSRAVAVPIRPEGAQANGESATPTVREQIVEFIALAPGLTSPEIADRLSQRGVAASAKDPRKSIQTVLGQLRDNEKVRRDDQGRYYPVS